MDYRRLGREAALVGLLGAFVPAQPVAGSSRLEPAAVTETPREEAAPQRCRLQIYVDDHAQLSTRTLEGFRFHVERIWREYGIAISWGPEDRDRQDSPGPQLVVVFDGDERSARNPGAQDPTLTLGQLQYSRPDGSARVIRIPAAARRWLADDGPFYSAALARVVAHEIGHHLLGSREHSSRGLMRASFSNADLRESACGAFMLTETEEALLASTWLGPPTCDAPSPASGGKALASAPPVVPTIPIVNSTMASIIVAPVYAARQLVAPRFLQDGDALELVQRFGPPEALVLSPAGRSGQVLTLLFSNMRVVLSTHDGAVSAGQAAVRSHERLAFHRVVEALSAMLGAPAITEDHRIEWRLPSSTVEIVGAGADFNLTIRRRSTVAPIVGTRKDR